jgi:hypothetical protein
VFESGLNYTKVVVPPSGAQMAAGNAVQQETQAVNFALDHPIADYVKADLKVHNSSYALQKAKVTNIDGHNEKDVHEFYCAPATSVKRALSFLNSVHQNLKPFSLNDFSITARLTNPEQASALGQEEKNRVVSVTFKIALHYVFA